MKHCKEYTELLEKEAVMGITVSEKLLTRFHMMICKECRQYKNDSQILEKILRLRAKTDSKVTFSESEIDEIIKTCKGH